MSFFKFVQNAFDSKLSQAGNGIDIAWENFSFKPSINEPWLRPTLLMARSDMSDLDGTQGNSGIYQVDVYFPLQRGVLSLLTKLDEIYDLFKESKTLISQDVQIILRAVSRKSSVIEESWYKGSIEIAFNFYNS